jgi:glycosyltransferase involved in cell wall biosynthesis
MKSRIPFMARALDHGGSERQLTEVALALDRARFEPHVGAFHVKGIRARELRAAGIPVTHLGVSSFLSPGALTAAWDLRRYIHANAIQAIHTFDPPLTMWAIPSTRLPTSALAVSSQRSHLGLLPLPKRRLVVCAHRMAHGVVVNSEFLRRHLLEDAGVPAGRIHLCRNGIDLERFHSGPGIRPATLPPGGPTIGVVCVLRPEKGLPTLVDAFAQVRHLAPGLRLAIVGSGPVLPELQRRARQLGVWDACVFEPSTDRVQDWLRNIDIFVLPSPSEGFSNALMEALACGCCAIACRAGGNPEPIEDGVTGLLFESGDAASLARALRETILNVGLRRRLADAGHDLLHTRFSRTASARRRAEIYTELPSLRAGTRKDTPFPVV